ncbi:MAG: divergent polysaccharide deacetylase family protein [Alphaproteobacteria bacterium]|nr:divergent polysaccharide deacetylase family protein [Alphaproteobacteria bacterium]
MDRSSLIRRARRLALRAAPEAAFAVLLGAALVTGGGAALAGLPKFLDAALPNMEAQALPDAGQNTMLGVARFVLPSQPQGGAQGGSTPQVLYPVVEQARPDWLTDAIAQQKGIPGLRSALDAPQGAPAAASVAKGPVIAICIDDLGEDLAGTDRAMALPKAVALSFLPYAEDTPFLAQSAARQGHAVLAHVPMQALGKTDPGPMALKTGMDAAEIARRLGWNLSRVPGLIGINNHEGSRFTADADALAPVMATLKARHLFFFDSRTGPDSAVPGAAAKAGVMSAGRDVFLDDDRNAAAVRAQLDELVREAKRDGVAIAIGHPHDVTLTILAQWLKQDHGVTLIPLDEALKLKAVRQVTLAAR